MKKMILGSCVATLIAGMALADTVTSVNVVGYYNLTVAGDATEAQFTLLSVPMIKMPADRGVISANTDSSISASGAGWVVSALAVAGGYPTHFVEVTSGGFVGRHFYIADNTADTLTLASAVGDLNVNDLAGATYKVVPVTTVSDVFGPPGGPIALLGGGSDGTADNIYMWSTGSGWVGPVFYKNAGFPVAQRDHWIFNNEIVDAMPIDRDEGLMVKRLPGNGDAALTVAGEVSGNLQSVVLDAGFSLQGGMSAVDVKIKDAGLYPGVLAGGGSDGTADNIYWWGENGGWQGPVFYKNAGFPVAQRDHWIYNNEIVDETFILEAGKAYLFKIADTANWDRESPLK